jgi:hypothetical protein
MGIEITMITNPKSYKQANLLAFQILQQYCGQPRISEDDLKSVRLLYAHQQVPLVPQQHYHLAAQNLAGVLQ